VRSLASLYFAPVSLGRSIGLPICVTWLYVYTVDDQHRNIQKHAHDYYYYSVVLMNMYFCNSENYIM
jgi:hypothetical protein